MTHIMLDLETLGTDPGAVILSIGAVAFDPASGALGSKFQQHIDPQSCIDAGLAIDPKAVVWWVRQDEAARRHFPEMDHFKVPLARALQHFTGFVRLVENESTALEGLWGNGVAMDNVLLAEAYRAAGCERPWSYKVDRCFRTLKMLRPDIEPHVFEGTRHDALADAVHQAEHAIRILRSMAPGASAA